MKRILTVLFIAFMGTVVTATDGLAQATAQISGAARDQSGAVLPGVEVTVTQTSTGVIRTTVSNETGAYALPNLALGPYRLEASLPGFRAFVQTGIVLQVSSNPVINVTLEVGQVTEQVEVQANASLVETRSVSVGQVMETERIMELPLNGRNVQELLVLSGGAVQVTPGAGGRSFPGRMVISSAGGLGFATDYNLDGMRHVSSYDGWPLPLPFPDALAEFTVETGGLSAQKGRASSVGAVTKSGTNAYHGDLFEFVRNDLFNARNYFAIKGSTLKRNQYGGTIGGPILKNKLFFFAGYQGTTLRQDPNDVTAFVPTAAMLAGDFTTFASPSCNAGRQITLRAPFVNDRVDPAQFSPAALNLTSRLPKATDDCAQIVYGTKSVSDEGQLVAKMDYQKSDKHSLFGRMVYGFSNTPSPFDFTPDNVLNASQDSRAKAYMFTFGSTYLISPTMINAFRLGFNATDNTEGNPAFFDGSDIGVKNFYSYQKGMINLSVSNGFAVSGNPRISRGFDYQLNDDVSVSRGTHQLGFGMFAAHHRSNSVANVRSSGNFTFNGQTTGAGLADFLLGRLSDFNQGDANFHNARVNYISAYGADVWQVKPRLTLNYGLRWSPVLPIMDYRRPIPAALNFDIDRYRRGIRSSTFVNAPPGMLYIGDQGFLNKNNGPDAAKPQVEVFNAYWFRFAPRLGLAWDVDGKGRTSVRANYALSFVEYPTFFRQGTQIGQQPWGANVRILSPAGGLDDPWRGVAGGNPFPMRLDKNAPFAPQGDYMVTEPDLPPTYSQSWNLSVQHEVVPGTLVSASYLGTLVIHLQASESLNPAVFVPGVGNASGNCFLNGSAVYYTVTPGAACSTLANTQSRRKLSFENPAFRTEIGRFGHLVFGGTQNYHGMLLSIQRRPSRGITVNGNYTLSHCIGDFAGRSNSGNSQNVLDTYQDINDRDRDRSNCDSDQRHAFNLTTVAETPRFANPTFRLLATGWRLSGIYRRSTGGNLVGSTAQSTPRTVTAGTATSGGSGSVGSDICLCDVVSQRPNLALLDVYKDRSGRPMSQWLNPLAFAQPAVGTLGTLGRNTLRLPTAWQFDVALSRVFKFRETQSMEFRAEAYNLTNSFRPGVINTNLSSGQFGQLRTSLEPRIMQFALKYIF
ncbi:MAG: TonB-dependent receptor [Bryobacterales bacterium]|nr:TonB-dependent receptor [Bryobacterales bacterium]